MKTSKKLIYFLLGFIGIWFFVLVIISLFLFGGSKGLIVYITSYIQNPKLSGEALKNPSGTIDGTFLYHSNEYGNPSNIICASDVDDAKKKVEEYFTLSFRTSNRYFSEDIASAKWQESKEYISAEFKREMDDNNKWNVLRCDYFVHQASRAPYSEVENIKLGDFGGEKTKKSLDDLVWFLMKIGVIQLTGFNQGATINKSEVTETDTEIVRKDSGIYTVHNDVPPFQSNSNRVVYTYSLDKQDGSLSYTRQTEDGK